MCGLPLKGSKQLTCSPDPAAALGWSSAAASAAVRAASPACLCSCPAPPAEAKWSAPASSLSPAAALAALTAAFSCLLRPWAAGSSAAAWACWLTGRSTATFARLVGRSASPVLALLIDAGDLVCSTAPLTRPLAEGRGCEPGSGAWPCWLVPGSAALFAWRFAYLWPGAFVAGWADWPAADSAAAFSRFRFLPGGGCASEAATCAGTGTAAAALTAEAPSLPLLSFIGVSEGASVPAGCPAVACCLLNGSVGASAAPRLPLAHLRFRCCSCSTASEFAADSQASACLRTAKVLSSANREAALPNFSELNRLLNRDILIDRSGCQRPVLSCPAYGRGQPSMLLILPVKPFNPTVPI